MCSAVSVIISYCGNKFKTHTRARKICILKARSLMNGSVNNFDATFIFSSPRSVLVCPQNSPAVASLALDLPHFIPASYLRFIDVEIGVPMFVNSRIPEQFIYLASAD